MVFHSVEIWNIINCTACMKCVVWSNYVHFTPAYIKHAAIIHEYFSNGIFYTDCIANIQIYGRPIEQWILLVLAHSYLSKIPPGAICVQISKSTHKRGPWTRPTMYCESMNLMHRHNVMESNGAYKWPLVYWAVPTMFSFILRNSLRTSDAHLSQ